MAPAHDRHPGDLQFLGNNQILQKVVYFAAPPPLDSQGSTKGRERQKILFNANKILNPEQFELVMGQFYQKEITCKNCRQKFSVYEEKRTDVNIAIRLVGDCAMDNADTVVLVTADSDILPPLQFIRQHFPSKKIRVYFPPSNFPRALYNFMKSNKKPVILMEHNKPKFFNSIMPDVVTGDNGISYTIPAKWKVT